MCNHDINKVLSCNILFKYMYQQGIMGRTRKNDYIEIEIGSNSSYKKTNQYI